jgi:hypothetical protein
MGKVYKYCDRHGLEILRSLEIKITPPDLFNDPFEFTPHVICSSPSQVASEDLPFLKERYEGDREAGRFTGSFQEFFDAYVSGWAAPGIDGTALRIQRDLLKKVSRHLGVLCVSSRPDSIVMWGHYCSNHHGLVIGFDSSHAPFAGLQPVQYVGKRPIWDLCPSLKPGSTEDVERWRGIMLTKNEEWCYERELRKLFRLDDVKKRRITDRNTGKKRDWFFSQVPAEAIVTVLLGVHSAQGLRKKVEGLLQGCLSHVKLCKGELHRGEFRLSFD